MAARFKKRGVRHRHHIAEWRRFRNLSQEALAERLETSKATISRIESGHVPFSQDFLEACAEELDCHPADLLERDPRDPEGIWSVWEQIPPDERRRAIGVLRAFTRSDL